MSKFLKKIVIFIIVGYLIGEGITRVFKLNVDVPDMYQNSTGLIKFRPNQTGYHVSGNKWIINKYGEFGYEPQSLDSLITVIGDSYIQNIMNPPECHQASYLASMTNGFGFYPCARDGAGFLEFMEMAKSIEHLNPIKQLLYVHHGDFVESVREIKIKPSTLQLSIVSNKVTYPKLPQSTLKKILYNFKFAYYLYRNYFLTRENVASNNRDEKSLVIDYEKVEALLSFVKKTYFTDNITLIFSPDSDEKVIELVLNHGFETIILTADNYNSWDLPDDSHWSCYGHEQAARQVASYLNEIQQSNRKKVSVQSFSLD